MKRTPGINSAIPWSMYELTTLLISARNLSVTSVLRPLTSCPMTLMMSWPPCGRAFAMSRSCSVTSWTISFFLCTSPLGKGTYSSASRSYSVAYASERPTRCATVPLSIQPRLESIETPWEIVRGRTAHLDCTRVGLDVDDISDRDPLLLYTLVDTRIEAELLGALGRLEGDDDVRDGLAVAGQRVLGLGGGQFGHLSLVHLLGLLYSQAYVSRED